METFAMFDDGSEVTLLVEVIADQLSLKGKQFSLTLQWYDNKKNIEMSKRVRIQIAGVHAEVHYDLKGVKTVKNLGLQYSSFQGITMNTSPTYQFLIIPTSSQFC